MSRHYNELGSPIQLHDDAAALAEVIGTARGAYTASTAGGEVFVPFHSVRQARITIVPTVLSVPAVWTDVFVRAWMDPTWDGALDPATQIPIGTNWEWVDIGKLLTDVGASGITIPYNRPILNWSPQFGRIALVGTPPAAVDVWVTPVFDGES